jgi:hypothetical protein
VSFGPIESGCGMGLGILESNENVELANGLSILGVVIVFRNDGVRGGETLREKLRVGG